MKKKHCYKCGRGGFTWRNFDWGWNLVDQYGKIHHCKEPTEIIIQGKKFVSDKGGCVERAE